MLSKRRLTQLVEEGRVEGWDDPRMPTICGLRRRGVPAAAIRDFVGMLAISKTSDNLVEAAMLDHAVRERLNKIAPRRFGVLRPLKLVIENYPEDESEFVDALNNPEDPDSGTRPIPFGRTLYVEADDFMEDPPKKFFRLAPGREARAALRLPRDLPGGGEGRVRRRHRAPLHLRPPRPGAARRPTGAR